MIKKFGKIVLVAICLFLSGCVAMEVREEGRVSGLPRPERKGVYHKVKRGETIWRIAKAYDIDVEEIVHANNIPDVAQVEENQLVFIPGATAVKEVMLVSSETETDFIWPVDGKVIRYFDIQNRSHPIEGIDIKVNEGVVVKAARSGRVVLADYLTGYGYTVIVDHEDGFHSVYAHNADVNVKAGNYVKRGTSLAHVGSAGGTAYLHFQIRKNTIEKNPLHYLP